MLKNEIIRFRILFILVGYIYSARTLINEYILYLLYK